MAEAARIRTDRNGHLVETKPEATPLGEAARTELHDSMLQQMEQHSPEGRDVHGIPRGVRLGLFAFAACAVVAALIVLGLAAGPPAVLLGIAIVAAMCGIAALPQWNAARIRRNERQEFEAKVDTKIRRVERKHSHQR